MGISLGPNRYGKAETRVVRLVRDGPVHEVADVNVSVALAGDFAAAHLAGDNAHVLPTDTQKNTVHAFAQRYGVGEIEAFALRLARHFVATQAAVTRARVSIEQYGWRRLGPHSFQRDGSQTRVTAVTVDGERAHVVSGVDGLVLMNTTDSEFTGFATDEYTTLPEATDRILATSVSARWRHAAATGDWAASHAGAVGALIAAFAGTYSHSLQETLYAMGRWVLESRPELVEVRLSLPNKHHFPVGGSNDVFSAVDRPYGLIEGSVLRDGASAEGVPWIF